jgi:hypothetical protein
MTCLCERQDASIARWLMRMRLYKANSDWSPVHGLMSDHRDRPI